MKRIPETSKGKIIAAVKDLYRTLAIHYCLICTITMMHRLYPSAGEWKEVLTAELSADFHKRCEHAKHDLPLPLIKHW